MKRLVSNKMESTSPICVCAMLMCAAEDQGMQRNYGLGNPGPTGEEPCDPRDPGTLGTPDSTNSEEAPGIGTLS